MFPINFCRIFSSSSFVIQSVRGGGGKYVKYMQTQFNTSYSGSNFNYLFVYLFFWHIRFFNNMWRKAPYPLQMLDYRQEEKQECSRHTWAKQYDTPENGLVECDFNTLKGKQPAPPCSMSLSSQAWRGDIPDCTETSTQTKLLETLRSCSPEEIACKQNFFLFIPTDTHMKKQTRNWRDYCRYYLLNVLTKWHSVL